MEMKKIREIIMASKPKEFIQSLFLKKYGCKPALHAIKSEYRWKKDERGRNIYWNELTMECDTCKKTFMHQETREEKGEKLRCPHCGFSCTIAKHGWSNSSHFLNDTHVHYTQVLGNNDTVITPCLVYYEKTEVDGELYHVLRRFHFSVRYGEIIGVRTAKCVIASPNRTMGSALVYESNEGRISRSEPSRLKDWFCSSRQGEIPCENVHGLEEFPCDVHSLEELLQYLDKLVSASERYDSIAAAEGRKLTAQFPVNEEYCGECGENRLEIYTDYFVLRNFEDEGERYRWIYTQNGNVNSLLKKKGEDWMWEASGFVRVYCDAVFVENVSRIRGTFLEKIGVFLIMNKRKEIFSSREDEYNVVNYLNQRVQYPLIETLLKIGMSRLIDSVCDGSFHTNMNRRHIWQKMKLSKANYDLIQRHDLSAEAVKLLQGLNRFDGALDADTLLLYQERLGDEGNIHELKRLMGQRPMTIKCLATYLESVWQLQGCPWEEGMRLWHDYLTMYKKYYGHMPSRKGDMYPDSLKKEHDLLLKRLNEKKDEIDILNFQGVNEKWEKLCYSDNRFCIMLPQSSADLIVESKELGHCVRAYAALVLTGEAVILFLRRTDKPAKPFFTMEFDGKDKILQIRGKGNRQISEINDSNKELRNALISFLHAWGKKNRIKVGV